MMTRGIQRTFLYTVLIATLTGCQHKTTEPQVLQVRVALPIDAINWHAIRLAQSQGFAAAEGIAIDITEAAGMSKGMEALLGGSVDITAGQLVQAIQIAAEGRDVRCFLSLHSRPSLTLVAAPSLSEKIKRVADLKGRPVGVSAPGSATHQFLNYLLVTHGLSASDVSVISVGTGASSIAALEHGKVDAAVLVGSGVTTFEGRHPEASVLADPRTAEGARQIFGSDQFPASSMIARADWLNSNAETVRKFVRAVRKSMVWIKDHSAEEVRLTIPEALRMPEKEADLKAILHSQQTMTPEGSIPPEAAQLALKFVSVSSEKVRNAKVDAEKVFTNEFALSK
jgi:NitT/TauT family transport system substrate-binding protein